MPVEFLSDEEAAVFGRYAGPPMRAELDRMFYLDDADLRLYAARRRPADRGRVAPSVHSRQRCQRQLRRLAPPGLGHAQAPGDRRARGFPQLGAQADVGQDAADDLACDEDWCRILSQSLVLLLWAGHSGSGSSCHPWLVSQARSAVGWFGSCLRS